MKNHDARETSSLSPAAPGFELRGVSKTFGWRRKTVLTDVNATIPGGRVYGLIGRNGAGKTTLLRGLAGQLRMKGEVTSEARPVWDNEAVLDQLILAGPDAAWPEDVEVRHLFAVGRSRWATWDEGFARQLIEDFQLDTTQPLKKMSRGQKSAVSIVLGLAAQCPITLLDEPYLGLDVQNRDIFYRHLLADLQRNPRTLIISTHHVHDVEKILDAVILLDGGIITGVEGLEAVTERVVELSGTSGAVESFLARLGVGPGSLLVDATGPGIRRAVLDLQGLAASEAPMETKQFSRTAPLMSMDRVSHLAQGADVRVGRVDLEQAVLALTGRDAVGAGDRVHNS